MSTPIGGWLVAKKLQWAEEASYGVPVASPVYQAIGYNTPVQISAPTSLTPLPTPASEDPLVLQERRIDEYNIDLDYRPFDTVFAAYGFNAQGAGTGSIDKSLSLAMSVLLGGGSTETFIQALGCRISSLSIGGRAGGPIRVRAKIACQVIPVPSTTVLAGTFAPNPGNIPLQFKDGGVTPVSIGGTKYNVNSISVSADRNLDRIPQPNSDLAQLLVPTPRKITGTVGVVWLSTDNYSRLKNDTAFTLVWTVSTAASITLTLSGCRFKLLSSINMTPTQTVYETYSFEALSATLTPFTAPIAPPPPPPPPASQVISWDDGVSSWDETPIAIWQ